MPRSVGLLAALLACAAPVAAQTPSASELDAVVTRGQLLFAYDRAAWLGSDQAVPRLRAAGRFEELQRTGGSWIVEGDVARPRLTFFVDWNRPRAIYTATFAANGKRLVEGRVVPADRGELTPQQLRLVAALNVARKAAVEQKLSPCGDRPFNSIVIPPVQPDGDVLVYLLTPQVRQGEWPLGGHYAITVSPAGQAVATRSFANSCLAIQRPPQAVAATAMTTHLRDPMPTELHIFTVLTSTMPMRVVTMPNERHWAIDLKRGRPVIRDLGVLPDDE